MTARPPGRQCDRARGLRADDSFVTKRSSGRGARDDCCWAVAQVQGPPRRAEGRMLLWRRCLQLASSQLAISRVPPVRARRLCWRHGPRASIKPQSWAERLAGRGSRLLSLRRPGRSDVSAPPSWGRAPGGATSPRSWSSTTTWPARAASASLRRMDSDHVPRARRRGVCVHVRVARDGDNLINHPRITGGVPKAEGLEYVEQVEAVVRNDARRPTAGTTIWCVSVEVVYRDDPLSGKVGLWRYHRSLVTPFCRSPAMGRYFRSARPARRCRLEASAHSDRRSRSARPGR
jgi:hypothetical protein